MSPLKTTASSSTAPPQQGDSPSSVDPDHAAKLKAEARAYALSGASSSTSHSRRKTKSSPLHSQENAVKPTSLDIHRPIEKTTHSANTFQQRAAAAAPAPPPPTAVTPGSAGPPRAMLPLPTAGRSCGGALVSDTDDDYERFVKSLGLDDSLFATENDDEDFQLPESDEEDLEDEFMSPAGLNWNADGEQPQDDSLPSSPSLAASPLPMHLDEECVGVSNDLYFSLEEELGSLLEEDMEAAVQSLLTSKRPSNSPSNNATTSSPRTPKMANLQNGCSTEGGTGSPTTPLRDAARQGTRAPITYQQSQQLRRLLTRHYQLLVQQSVLAVRAAHFHKLQKEKSDFMSGESSDDLAEILDGAVGMLQDLDQNRKDAIRDSIQLAVLPSPYARNRNTNGLVGRRSLLSKFAEDEEGTPQETPTTSATEYSNDGERRLTRAAFSKTLEQQSAANHRRTTFDIPGLMKLKETFSTIDTSVDGGAKSGHNILEVSSHAEACRMVLKQAGGHPEESYIPGNGDLSENFTHSKETFGEDFNDKSSEDQQMFLRRNRNLFTSGEDNLVLRGVNLYGEKQWILIADRYLPDRSVNIISQRYSKICVMLYKASGISIDDGTGALIEPPKLESVDDIDNVKVDALGLTKVDPPAILNVHRWSLDEDLTLLKAVPLMGHMWAELGARLIPHRDRGHLRKRYQVLERRVKATITRGTKGDMRWRGATASRKVPATARSSILEKISLRAPPKRTSKRSPVKRTRPPMTIVHAAASLATLRPPKKVEPRRTIASDMPPMESPAKRARLTQSPKSRHRHSGTPSKKLSSHLPPSKEPGLDAHLAKETGYSNGDFEPLSNSAGGEEWSQISRMKRMLENDAESQAAGAIVSQLGKSPLPSSLSRLPQMQLDSNSLSGFSVLQSEPSRLGENDGLLPDTSESSIMAKVLEGEKKRASSGDTDKAGKEGRFESPRKRMKGLPSFSTPKKVGNFFSTTGTPAGFSSPGLRSPAGFRSGITLTPNAHYSPPASTMMRIVGDQSVDNMEFACDFDSPKELSKEAPSQKPKAKRPTLKPSKNSQSFGEQELDAMEALQAMSNSPMKPKKRSTHTAEEMSPLQNRRSLFATVIGGIDEKNPKTKLKF